MSFNGRPKAAAKIIGFNSRLPFVLSHAPLHCVCVLLKPSLPIPMMSMKINYGLTSAYIHHTCLPVKVKE